MRHLGKRTGLVFCLCLAAVTEADAAINYNKGVYNKADQTAAGGAGVWTTGNAGSNYLENQWAFYQYQVTGVTAATGVPNFDIVFNHFQSGPNAVFVDAFANFKVCLDDATGSNPARCKDTNPSGPKQGMLLDGIPFPALADWIPASTAVSNINRPFTGGVCQSAEEPVPNGTTTFPAASHCFHLTGSTLATLLGGIPATGTHTVTLFYEAHLAATSVWMAGNESLLNCTGVNNYVSPGSEIQPAMSVYGTDAYSNSLASQVVKDSGDCTKGNGDDWTTAFKGVAAATGSSRHFEIQNQSAGPQGGLTLPIPTVPALVCDPALPCCLADGSGFRTATTTCRAAAGPCDVAESCDASSATCPADVFASFTTICRGSAGICDVAESCTGSSAACPADAFSPITTTCRPSAGQCDVAESCTGSSAACPVNGFQPATTTCTGTSNGGPCDGTDSCSGTANTCVDGFLSSTTVCRASAGQCDVAESCSGSSGACPADAFSPSTTICRASTNACDPAESCTGSDVSCPADVNPGCGACRTAGYWATHAGTEGPAGTASVNVTQLTIDTNLGSISVCGLLLTNTNLDSSSSAEEVLCDPGGGKSQLERQLTAMALNCVNSGSTPGNPACDSVPAFETAFNMCNAVCISGTSTQSQIGACIDLVDCLNNGGTPSLQADGTTFFCATGKCSDNMANCSSYLGLCGDPGTATCIPFASTCHDRPLLFPDTPAGSSNKCNDAKGTACEPGIVSCTNP